MEHPSPLLAGCGRALIAAAVAELTLTAAILLYAPFNASDWYGGRLAATWAASPPEAVAAFTWMQVGDLVWLATPPLGLLLAAHLLRLVATWRLSAEAVGGSRAGRRAALAGMWGAVLLMAVSGARWSLPGWDGPPLARRLRDGADHGLLWQHHSMPLEGSGHSQSLPAGRRPHVTVLPPLPLRVALTAGWEANRGLAAVRPAAVLFCLCGVAVCLCRPAPDSST